MDQIVMVCQTISNNQLPNSSQRRSLPDSKSPCRLSSSGHFPIKRQASIADCDPNCSQVRDRSNEIAQRFATTVLRASPVSVGPIMSGSTETSGDQLLGTLPALDISSVSTENCAASTSRDDRPFHDSLALMARTSVSLKDSSELCPSTVENSPIMREDSVFSPITSVPVTPPVALVAPLAIPEVQNDEDSM